MNTSTSYIIELNTLSIIFYILVTGLKRKNSSTRKDSLHKFCKKCDIKHIKYYKRVDEIDSETIITIYSCKCKSIIKCKFEEDLHKIKIMEQISLDIKNHFLDNDYIKQTKLLDVNKITYDFIDYTMFCIDQKNLDLAINNYITSRANKKDLNNIIRKYIKKREVENRIRLITEGKLIIKKRIVHHGGVCRVRKIKKSYSDILYNTAEGFSTNGNIAESFSTDNYKQVVLTNVKPICNTIINMPNISITNWYIKPPSIEYSDVGELPSLLIDKDICETNILQNDISSVEPNIVASYNNSMQEDSDPNNQIYENILKELSEQNKELCMFCSPDDFINI